MPVPQNGRNFEYFGEDPRPPGHLAISEIEAIQKEDVIAAVKHYAANSQEADRKTVNEAMYSIWDTSTHPWSAVPGLYEILAGDSSRNLLLHQSIRMPAR